MANDLMLLGDVHGDLDFLERRLSMARLHDVRHIIQLGDFGIWSGSKGKAYRESVIALTEQYQVRLDFLDGNHDNHECLRELVDEYGWENPILMGGGLHYLPRGCRFLLGNTKFGVLGGAFSIDLDRRVEGVSWWRRETIESIDLARLGDEPVDILLTHDSPKRIDSMCYPLRPELEQKSLANRKAVLAAIEQTHPHTVYHGHWHIRVSYSLPWRGGPQVHGLAHNDAPCEDSYVCLDTSDA
jgi:predicted phosphodiesterase